MSKKCYWECECVVLAYFSAVVYIIYKDYYILTRLYKRDGKIEMDYEYQKIIEKTDTETFNCENIYGINIGE